MRRPLSSICQIKISTRFFQSYPTFVSLNCAWAKIYAVLFVLRVEGFDEAIRGEILLFSPYVRKAARAQRWTTASPLRGACKQQNKR